MEDDRFFFKWKTTSNLLKMEDDLNFLENVKCKISKMKPETFKTKTMVVAPLRVTLSEHIHLRIHGLSKNIQFVNKVSLTKY